MATLTTRSAQSDRRPSRWSSPGWGIVMILAGVAAIALPMVAGLSLLAILASVLVIGAFAHAVYSLMSRRARTFAWHALVALLYGGAAAYMIMDPVAGLASLAMVLAVVFIFEGGLLMGAWWVTRRLPRSGWLLANGLLSVALGILILTGWPASSGPLLGVLVGVNLLFSGVARLFYRPEQAAVA
jgi:uncharacterized membrane protein HdeD (DUF308 family)